MQFLVGVHIQLDVVTVIDKSSHCCCVLFLFQIRPGKGWEKLTLLDFTEIQIYTLHVLTLFSASFGAISLIKIPMERSVYRGALRKNRAA